MTRAHERTRARRESERTRAASEHQDEIVFDGLPEPWLHVFANDDVGVAAEQLAELDSDPGQIEQREVLRGRHADRDVDIAPATGIAARQGAEQPEPRHAERTQLGLVLANRTHHTLALDERRIGSLEVGGHGESYGATAGPYRRATGAGVANPIRASERTRTRRLRPNPTRQQAS